jgi:dihydroceramidase
MFKVAYLSTAVVGLGSIAFHATLKKEWQWTGNIKLITDEVPMLYSAISVCFIIVSQRYSLSLLQKRLLASLLCFHAVFTTLLVTLTEGSLQFVFFHLSFGTLEFYSLIQGYPNLTEVASMLNKKEGKLFQIGIFGFISYILGITCWIIDLTYCSIFTNFNPQLHAFWHIFVRF